MEQEQPLLWGYDEETVKRLRADFPKESVQVKKGFKDPDTGEQRYLTGYKPQYIFERLNDCFGHCGWDFEIIREGLIEQQVWVLGRLSIIAPVVIKGVAGNSTIERKPVTIKEQFGNSAYNKYMPVGDAYKSAASNALEKCASLLDIGHLAYKGLVPIPDGTNTEPKGDTEIKDLKSKLATICKKNSINKESFPTLVKTVLKREDVIGNLSVDEIKQLIEHVEKNGSPF